MKQCFLFRSSHHHCTNMNPMVLICLSPLFDLLIASFPHVLLKSGWPPVPNPILELQLVQLRLLLPIKPILALEFCVGDPSRRHCALKPSLLHLFWRDASEPISAFHLFRPNEVWRYSPSAISEYRDSACLFITINLMSWLIFIPRQILEKDVFQYVGNLVSIESNPVLPPPSLKVFLSLQYTES